MMIKNIKHISVILILGILCFIPKADAESFPKYPMSFWGNVNIMNSPAPVGTVIRAYYGDNLAGQIIVRESGIYGYTEPIKQKLIIGENTGVITFKFQNSSLNSGAETGGTVPQLFSAFEEGQTKNLNLNFSLPDNGGGGVGVGSGVGVGVGSGGGGTPPPVSTTTSTIVATSSKSLGQVLSATTFQFTRSLRKGAEGNDVAELQKRLITEGVYNGPVTGYFGSLTETGVKAYQRKYGIDPFGLVGPITIARLNLSLTLTQSSTPTSTPINILGVTTFIFSNNLGIGSRGEDVTELQKRLIAERVYVGDITGYFGVLTKAAIVKYQTAHNIVPQSGFVGGLTRAELNR